MSRASMLYGVVMLLTVSAGRADAQFGYPVGYGGYGWGGWGSTPQSALARGLGSFSMGRGAYNYDTAMARSINTDTVLRWNQSVYQSQIEANRRYAARQRRRQAEINQAQAEIHDRLRHHPETRDITDGDALNVLLDELLDPAILSVSLRTIRTPLKAEIIQDIPFEYTSEGMTICLDQMTLEEGWPLALRVEAFRPEREAVRKAVQVALEQDKAGDIEPSTIDAVQSALDTLRRTFEATVPQTSPTYIPARDHLKAMAGITRMLYSPKAEQVIAELEDYQGTTLGDLLGFMQAFNLRFAPANSFRQRRIYLKLYPMLAEQADGTLGAVAGRAAGGAVEVRKDAGKVVRAAEGTAQKAAGDVEKLGAEAVNGLRSAAVDLFKDMDWKHLGGADKPPAPQP